MNKTHNVKLGDRLYMLSVRYYGTGSRWKEIESANPQLKGRKTAIDGSPLIFPGDILIIPENTKNKAKPPAQINSDNPDEISIIIDGNKFSFFTEYKLKKAMDSFDTFTFSAPFEVLEQIYMDSFRPFNYKECQIYYGEDIQFNGLLLAPQSSESTNLKTISLTGYPKCGILSDVNLPITKFPMEFNNQDLKKISENICQVFSLSVEFSENQGNPFKKVAPEPSQKCQDFLIELSGQRGFLMTNNIDGDLKYWKTTTGQAICYVKSGETPYLGCQSNFNPQEFYSHITGLLKASATRNAQKYTVVNNYLVNFGIIRPYNYNVSDAEAGDLQASVKAKAGRMFANSCSYTLSVQGHKDKNGNLWQPNTIITVYAPNAMIYQDYDFLIREVNFSRNNQGNTTELNLVIPGSFSGVIPEVFPWQEN